jgi:hypothetical protein
MGGRLYVYAVVRSGSSHPLGTGIEGAPLRLIRADELAAIVHDHGQAPPFGGVDADVRRRVLEHGQVIERFWDHAGTVLPMTFNVLVRPGEDASAEERLAAWLRGNSHELATRLDALRDRVELRIEVALDQHVVGSEDPEVRELRAERLQRPPGVQRLLQKRIDNLERELADQLADTIHPEIRRRISGLSEAVTENRGSPRVPGSVSVLSVSALVRRSQVGEMGEALSTITVEQPAARVRFLGPWPPYSFVEFSAPADG